MGCLLYLKSIKLVRVYSYIVHNNSNTWVQVSNNTTVVYCELHTANAVIISQEAIQYMYITKALLHLSEFNQPLTLNLTLTLVTRVQGSTVLYIDMKTFEKGELTKSKF